MKIIANFDSTLNRRYTMFSLIFHFTHKGDYKCDDPDGNLPEHHIAAWDHPSMDYISKDDENIIFTLCQVKISSYKRIIF